MPDYRHVLPEILKRMRKKEYKISYKRKDILVVVNPVNVEVVGYLKKERYRHEGRNEVSSYEYINRSKDADVEESIRRKLLEKDGQDFPMPKDRLRTLEMRIFSNDSKNLKEYTKKDIY